MSLFNVVQPCVVNGLHYVHPTTQPIKVDDEQAAELVAAGSLEPYPKSAPAEPIGDDATERVSKVQEVGEGGGEISGKPRIRRPRTEG